jgi:hypothetical protein
MYSIKNNIGAEMSRRIKSNIISVKTFVVEVIFYWVIQFVFGYTWVNGYDIISDTLRIVAEIGMLILIVSGLLTIIQIKRNFSSDNSKSVLKKFGIVVLFVTVISIHSFMYFSFSEIGYYTNGLFNLTDKQIIDGKYYFYIKGSNPSRIVELECTKDVYETIIIDKDVLYNFSYRWLTYNDDIGVVDGSIDTSDIIDNRHSITK